MGTQFREPNQPIPLRRNNYVSLALPEGGRFVTQDTETVQKERYLTFPELFENFPNPPRTI
jgi:hypothetical protein